MSEETSISLEQVRSNDQYVKGHADDVFTIHALLESNNILQDEVSRLRNTNRVLRTVHSALRSANDSLRAQLELARFSDDTFKRFCAGEFDAVVANDGEGALPKASSVVDPLV